VQVKYDAYPTDKHDKWFEVRSPEIRHPAAAPAVQNGNAKKDKEVKIDVKTGVAGAVGGAATASGFSPDSTHSAAVAAANDSSAALEEMSKTFRNLLLYFVPPGFTIPAESIQTMSHKELSQFPIDEFITKYNTKLGMMIEEQLKEGKAEISQKLSHNRRLVCQMLRHSGVDVDDDSEEVDRHLEMFLQQTTSLNN
jgi:hypothetical protein